MGNDSKDSLPNKNRESGTTSFLGNILTDCFLFTEFDFCIFVNDHFAGRTEEVGQGKEVRASFPGQGAVWGKKFGLEISHFKSGHKEARKRNGRHFSRGRV